MIERRMEIAAARLEDAEPYASFVAKNALESGRDGSPHFALARRVDENDVRHASITRWSRRLDEPAWGRAWLLWCIEAEPARTIRRVVGNVELRGGRVPAELHRAVLGMGILREHTNQGHGTALMRRAIQWAKRESTLAFVDLGVFENNLPARKLYAKMGFVEQGRRSDAFRIDDGVRIVDLHLTLDLAKVE